MNDDQDHAAREFAASLFSHPEPEQAAELDQPATAGNHVAREGHDPGSPVPHDDVRQLARDLFSN